MAPRSRLQMAEGDTEKKSLQGSVLLQRQHSLTQPRRNQFSAIRSEELRSLRQDANEVQREEVGLVYDFVIPNQLILVIIRPLNDPTQLLHHGARQVAGRGQLQSTCVRCSSKQV
jgi:hypothetical protein